MTTSGKPHQVTHLDLVELRDQVIALRTEMVERIDKEGDRIDGLFAEHDVRYGQRFAAQGEALAAALTAAEKAVAAALAATKESNAAAQAAADRAVQKAEIANDQRFGTIVEKLDAVAAQVGLLANTGAGLKAGWGYLIAALAAASILYNLFESMVKP